MAGQIFELLQKESCYLSPADSPKLMKNPITPKYQSNAVVILVTM